MEAVFADIELINAEDTSFARKFITGEEEIKRMYVNIRVDY